MRKLPLLIVLNLATVSVLPFSSYAARPEGCSAAREYITSLEYLRANPDFKIPESEAQKTALTVAKGCTGAAQRFIRTVSVLVGSGMTTPDALKAGLELAARTDREAETFVAVFKKAFLSENLDLDLRSAIKMAKSMSTEFSGDVLAVRNDFETVVEYCTSAKKLNLSKGQCATIALNVAKASEKWEGGVSGPFISAFEYLASAPGPELPTDQSLKIAQELMAQGPQAPLNFMQAYRYAVSDKGLKLQRNEAISFAKEIASHSYPKAN